MKTALLTLAVLLALASPARADKKKEKPTSHGGWTGISHDVDVVDAKKKKPKPGEGLPGPGHIKSQAEVQAKTEQAGKLREAPLNPKANREK